MDQASLPSSSREYEHYLLHENDPDDARYRAFVSRLGDHLIERVEPGSTGLDYGCGSGPALAAIFEERGHPISLYDPYFHDNASVFDRSYDFIICCAVAEHFHEPADEFARLNSLLRPGGHLGLMTCFRTDHASFEGWYCRRDPTHVVFYTEETLRRIAQQSGWSCEILRKDVAIMRKTAVTI